ncbi:MAG: hypothetical protein RSE97_04790, partial [Oscillospiraceae bacterium]
KLVCSDCGQEKTESHTLTDSVKTPASCTAAGVTTHTCSCGYAAAETEIPIVPHDYEAWSDLDATNHQHKCKHCSKIEQKPHVFT